MRVSPQGLVLELLGRWELFRLRLLNWDLYDCSPYVGETAYLKRNHTEKNSQEMERAHDIGARIPGGFGVHHRSNKSPSCHNLLIFASASLSWDSGTCNQGCQLLKGRTALHTDISFRMCVRPSGG